MLGGRQPDSWRPLLRVLAPVRDACEQRAQLRLLHFVELAQELALGLVAGAYRLTQSLVACVGECDDIAAAVPVVGVTCHQTLRFEPVEQGDHGRSVDLESCGCLPDARA